MGQFGIGLAVLLCVHAATGSFGIAGTATGAMAAGIGLGRVLQGRLIDRLGVTRVLLSVLVPFLVSIALLAAATVEHAAAPIMIGLSCLVGIGLPALDTATRLLWGALAPEPDARMRAYSLDAMAVEMAAILGTTIAGALGTAVSPSLALITMGVLAGGGGAGIALVRVTRTTASASQRNRGALARTLVLPLAIMFGIGLMAGAIEVGVPAFAAQHGSRIATGPLFACWGVGSMLGGLWYGSRAWRVRPERRLVLCLAALAVGCAALPLAPSNVALGALLVLFGMPVPPAMTTLYLLVDDLVPHERLGEAFSWLTSAIPAGIALGNVLGGWSVAGASPRAALGLAALLALPALVAAARIVRGVRDAPVAV